MKKAQGKLLELIIGGIFVIFLLIAIYGFFLYNHYRAIERITEKNAYEVAILAYKIAQSDQILSISSKDKGFLDIAKLQSIDELGNEKEVCNYIEKLINSKIYLYIKDLDGNLEEEICSQRKNKPMYIFDLYVNLYDPYNNTIHMGYIKIGVLS